jgi:hypothetical protein
MKTRKIPLISFVIMGIIAILGVATYYITENGKSAKLERILNETGYNNITSVKVYGITKVENKDTRVQGFRYFVIFKNHKAQECRGFIMKDFKDHIIKDISCKDKK